jgi:hypothetical protein
MDMTSDVCKGKVVVETKELQTGVVECLARSFSGERAVILEDGSG